MTEAGEVRLLLGGDVMLGRGIDQVLPHPGDPRLPASIPKCRDARLMVALAQLMHGPLPAARGPDYVWGDGLADFAACRADLRLINLETAITARGRPWPKKPIHYRMHPANTDALKRADIDFCALANNHTLDFGREGLADTVAALAGAGIRHAGAGRNRREAAAPAVLQVPGKGRVLVFSLALPSSGVSPAWAAQPQRSGLNLVGINDPWIGFLRDCIAEARRPGDLVVASIHWGDNFEHGIAAERRAFARRLIDEAKVDLIHGHSAHHLQGIEVHGGKLILYGCGDLINDYEGSVKRPARQLLNPDLGAIYLARLAPGSGRLLGLEMRPTRMYRLQLRRARPADRQRLAAMLNRFGKAFGTQVAEDDDGVLQLRWAEGQAAAS